MFLGNLTIQWLLMNKMRKLLCVVLLYVVYRIAAEGLGVGERCTQHSLPGVCRRRSACATVTHLPIDFRMISPCEDNDVESVVCCLGYRITPVAGLPTAEYLEDPSLETHCAPVPEELTAEKTGRKAWDKCIEYQKQLIYPCKRSVSLMGGYNRRNNCKHSAGPIIVAGFVSTTDEFPHMVQLGFDIGDYVAWGCSGTLLSDWYILTAGHCTSQPIRGQNDKYAQYKVSYAAVGSLQNQNQRETVLDGYQVYAIRPEDIIKHPDYRPPKKYHDIALLKTSTRIILNPSAVPSCLPIFGGDTTYVTATGWGQTEVKDSSYILRKVMLTRFSEEVCLNKTRGARLGAVNSTIQLCYGHNNERADTCVGDSGGPVTIHNPRVNCMYAVIGITSYARFHCGTPGIPGIYTNVAYYVPWIESIVWTDSDDTS